MSFISVLGAFATILAAGGGLLSLLDRNASQQGLAGRLALSWLLGTGIVALLLWFFGFFTSGPLLPGLVALSCLVLALWGWKTNRLRAIPQCVSLPGRTEIVLGALLTAEVAAIFYLSYIHSLGNDGILNWEIKARYAYLNGGTLPLGYLQDAGRAFSHQEYPLGIPYTELWLYFWLGEPNQFWAKTIFPAFYLVGIVLLANLGAKLSGKILVGLTLSALLFFVPQVSVAGGSTTVGYADFPLSVFYLATIGYLLCACRTKDQSAFWIYAGCLALLPWVKREGIILWLVAAVCGVLVIWRTKRPWTHLFALLPGALVIFAWRFYLWKAHYAASSDFLAVNFASFSNNVHRLGPILRAFLSEFANLTTWSLFWLLVAIGGIYFVRRYRDIRSAVLLIAVLAPIGVYALIYVFSNWPDYQEHILFSVSRLLMHVASLACLTLSAALAEIASVQSSSAPSLETV
jgi:hypothetical protein